VLGSISPPSGDFSEPVTSHTKRYVKSYWALDARRAQARFYPAVHPLQSYSEDAGEVAPWWQAKGNSEWTRHRERLLTLLELQSRLERMARIVGKDALPASQQVALVCAELINEALLRQSSFSKVDRYCSPARQTAMLRVVIHFIDLAEQAVAHGLPPAKIASLPVLAQLQRLGEEFGEEAIPRIEALAHELDGAFHALEGGSDAVR
jgi:V/A-type H+-transporting ATPase subunit A